MGVSKSNKVDRHHFPYIPHFQFSKKTPYYAKVERLKVIIDPGLFHIPSKGGFSSERAICFSNLQNKNIPKNYPELEIQISSSG